MQMSVCLKVIVLSVVMLAPGISTGASQANDAAQKTVKSATQNGKKGNIKRDKGTKKTKTTAKTSTKTVAKSDKKAGAVGAVSDAVSTKVEGKGNVDQSVPVSSSSAKVMSAPAVPVTKSESDTATTTLEDKSSEQQPAVELAGGDHNTGFVEEMQVSPVAIVKPEFVRELGEPVFDHNDSNPNWNQNGGLIGFERAQDKKKEIVITDKEGNQIKKIYYQIDGGGTGKDELDLGLFLPGIAEAVSYNSGISWSNDGRSFVFMSNGGEGNYDIYLSSLDSEETLRLTTHKEKDGQPVWSPMADYIAFVSGRSGKADIYLMSIEDRKPVKLTNGKKQFMYPAWSPSGKSLVMIYGDNENHDIVLLDNFSKRIDRIPVPVPAEQKKKSKDIQPQYIEKIAVDSKNIRQKILVDWKYDDLTPTWSPDGKYIAFYTNYNEQNDPKIWSIAVIKSDGSDISSSGDFSRNIVATNIVPDVEKGPAWYPDSKRIVYVKNEKESYNPINVVDVASKTVTKIDTDTKINHDVSCSADGLIAFRAQVDQWDKIFVTKVKFN